MNELVQNGANVTTENKYGETGLHIAAKNGIHSSTKFRDLLTIFILINFLTWKVYIRSERCDITARFALTAEFRYSFRHGKK